MTDAGAWGSRFSGNPQFFCKTPLKSYLGRVRLDLGSFSDCDVVAAATLLLAGPAPKLPHPL